MGHARSGREPDRAPGASLPDVAARASGSSPAAPEKGAGGAPAVVLVADDDLRLLVRGVLTLERHPVILEATEPESLRRLGPPERETVLILDAGDGRGNWKADLATALKERPELRPVVLLPRGGDGLRSEAERLGARATVVRPIVLHELVRALDDALAGDPRAA